MSPADDKAMTALYRYFRPLLERAFSGLHAPLGPAIAMKRALGWRSPYTKKLERAMSLWVEDLTGEHEPAIKGKNGPELTALKQELHVFPEFRDMSERFRDINLIMSDMERTHYPVWLQKLFNRLYEAGLIEIQEG